MRSCVLAGLSQHRWEAGAGNGVRDLQHMAGKQELPIPPPAQGSRTVPILGMQRLDLVTKFSGGNLPGSHPAQRQQVLLCFRHTEANLCWPGWVTPTPGAETPSPCRGTMSILPSAVLQLESPSFPLLFPGLAGPASCLNCHELQGLQCHSFPPYIRSVQHYCGVALAKQPDLAECP